MQTVIDFIEDGSTPDVPVGAAKSFIVAVRRHHDNKVYTFAALYLNEYVLEYDEEPFELPATGWFYDIANDDDGKTYFKLLSKSDKLEAWAEIPQYQPVTQ